VNRGYRDQGKSKKPKAKPGFAINPEQMEYERRKLLEEMSSKLKPNRKQLNTMAAVAATKDRSTLTTKERKENQQCVYYRSAQGFSLPVSHSWRKKD